MYFKTFSEARDYLISFGSVVEVLEPQMLRFSQVDYSQQIIKPYTSEQ